MAPDERYYSLSLCAATRQLRSLVFEAKVGIPSFTSVEAHCIVTLPTGC